MRTGLENRFPSRAKYCYKQKEKEQEEANNKNDTDVEQGLE